MEVLLHQLSLMKSCQENLMTKSGTFKYTSVYMLIDVFKKYISPGGIQ